MALSNAKLVKKISLTPDVYELHYDLGENKKMLPGQFITFILPGVGGRAYSILKLNSNIVILIIKRWSQDMGGRGGSILLCDAKIGDTFNYVGPNGHFTLSIGDISRCFLGTGTGFVPLYNQILGSLERGDSSNIHFIFGARNYDNLFYIQELTELSQEHSNFSYSLYLSKEKHPDISGGYVTDFLSEENTSKYSEFYICGAPAMIESSQARLTILGVDQEKIFFEKY